MKLYTFPLSGHAHRAELLLSLLGVDHELEVVDLAQGAHKQAEFLNKNIFGQVPVLEDEGNYIADSNAILVYLARKLNRTDWYPDTPLDQAEVQRWLSVAAGQIAYGPAAARLVTVFGAKLDHQATIKRAHDILQTIENHLEGRQWLASPDTPTIADVSLYSYIWGAPEGNVSLDNYPRVQAFLKRIEALPGFHPFPSTAAGLRA